MRIHSLLLAAFLVAQAARAADRADLPAVAITLADQGKTVALKPGQSLQIILDANRTTGFSWSVDKIDPALLTLVGQPVYATAEIKPGLVGTGGTESWHLIAVAPGEQKLRFVYRRSFEPSVPPARDISFTVRINP